MNRRDFLLLRRERDVHVVELSCRTLYMRCLDAQLTGENAIDPSDRPDAFDAPDPWGNEPPAVLTKRTVADLFDAISSVLRSADVLRVVDAAWLGDAALREHLHHAIEPFVARGGRVETLGS